jgi:hypothetical protein
VNIGGGVPEMRRKNAAAPGKKKEEVMKTLDVLINARALINEEAAYKAGQDEFGLRRAMAKIHGRTVGACYRKPDGSVTFKLTEASCFCSAGAITAAVGADVESNITGLHTEREETPNFYKVAGTTKPTKSQRLAVASASRYLTKAIAIVSGRERSIFSFNDTSRHEWVLKAFDLAIKNAKRRHPNGGSYRNGTSRKPAVNPDAPTVTLA